MIPRLRPAMAAGLALLCAALLVVSSALADTKASPEARRARALFEEGVALSDEGKWPDALAAFQKSDELVRSASARFNVGAALRALGRYVEARKVLAGILAEASTQKPPLKPALQKDIEKLLAEVKTKVVRVSLRVSPRDADVQADGAPLVAQPDGSVELDPGRHVFVVTAKGHDTTTVSKTIAAADVELSLVAPKSAVSLRPIEAPRPFYTRPWFLVTAGVLVAGGAAAAIVVVTLPKAPEPAGPPSSTVERVVPAGFRF